MKLRSVLSSKGQSWMKSPWLATDDGSAYESWMVPYSMSIHLKLDGHFSTRRTMIAGDDRFSRISRAMT